MNPPSSTEPGANKVGETACGARIMITTDTPFIHYRDEIIYFCGAWLPACYLGNKKAPRVHLIQGLHRGVFI
jgi:hypothetical protein